MNIGIIAFSHNICAGLASDGGDAILEKRPG